MTTSELPAAWKQVSWLWSLEADDVGETEKRVRAENCVTETLRRVIIKIQQLLGDLIIKSINLDFKMDS